MDQTQQNPRDMLNASRKDPKYEIEHKYDAKKFDELDYDPNFVNVGEENYKKARIAWREEISDDDEDEDYEDIFGDDSTTDIDHVIQQLRQYKPFSEPVSLRNMAELLECIWLESPNL